MSAFDASKQTSLENPSGSIAAVDLGSNSFHLIIARAIGDELSVLDRLREPIRLAAGLDDQNRLSEETLERALTCLERFSQRLDGLPPTSVRAVGTQTLRRAVHPANLVERLGGALGFPLEVLPGQEEARLIYLGVAHDTPRVGRRLVIDIGGGSTECILGEGFTPIFTESLSMGCVTWSQRFFPDGRITKKGFAKAVLAAQLELEPIQRRFVTTGWDEAVGASGTIKAVAEILGANEMSSGTISAEGLHRLRRMLLEAESFEALDIPGLQAERKPVIVGGFAILVAVFEALKLPSLAPVRAALREGLLFDLLGRIRHEDVRDRTIRALSERYHVDVDQAFRVERTALRLLRGCQEEWNLPPEEGRRLLTWASRLHEVGLAIAYSGHHKHGEYILTNTNLPGFSREDKSILAALVRLQRRKLHHDLLATVPSAAQELTLRLALLLRLSVRLHRARSTSAIPDFTIAARPTGLALQFPQGWIEKHPLTRADLEEERSFLGGIGFTLDLG